MCVKPVLAWAVREKLYRGVASALRNGLYTSYTGNFSTQLVFNRSFMNHPDDGDL
jgi:hypothetical protein